MFTGKSVLVTGGTGSFGRKFVETVLKNHPEIERLVVFSRDELKQFEMSQLFPEAKYRQLRYFIGDVRDKERLRRAFEGIDIVVHAAALKQIPACEYNPFEAIKTNILGAQKLCCEVFLFNAGVIKMHEKFGFSKEGHLVAHYLKNDTYEDIASLAMFNDSWVSAKETLKIRCFGKNA